jgi:hypothetical protein
MILTKPSFNTDSKAKWQYGKRNNIAGTGNSNMKCSSDKGPHGCGNKMLALSGINPDNVLSWAGLNFGSGYVNRTSIIRAGLAPVNI